jgi:hypothetical protein
MLGAQWVDTFSACKVASKLQSVPTKVHHILSFES